MKSYVTIDVGGTEIKYGLLDEFGNFLEKAVMATPAKEGGPAILFAVEKIVEHYHKQMEISGVCISSCGVVDSQKGEIIYASGIQDFIGVAYKKSIEEQFQVPCEVENDVNCAGLAEYKSGAAQGSKNMICLTVGTGIGGCAVIEGKLLHGASCSAMEIGYLPMEENEFQTLGSTKAMCQNVAAKKGELPEAWNGKRVFQAAKAGDEICIQAINEMCRVLCKGISAICYVLNPDTLVLGGGIMAQEDYLRPIICRELEKQMRPMIFQSLTVRFAHYQNDAGMLGAFYHFMDCMKQ